MKKLPLNEDHPLGIVETEVYLLSLQQLEMFLNLTRQNLKEIPLPLLKVCFLLLVFDITKQLFDYKFYSLIFQQTQFTMICTAASCAGSCLAQGMCCCFSCCCQQLSQAFRRLLGLERVTKLFYLFLVAIFTIPAIVVLFFINQWQSFISYFSWLSCPSGSGGYIIFYLANLIVWDLQPSIGFR